MGDDLAPGAGSSPPSELGVTTRRRRNGGMFKQGRHQHVLGAWPGDFIVRRLPFWTCMGRENRLMRWWPPNWIAVGAISYYATATVALGYYANIVAEKALPAERVVQYERYAMDDRWIDHAGRNPTSRIGGCRGPAAADDGRIDAMSQWRPGAQRVGSASHRTRRVTNIRGRDCIVA